MNRRIFILKTNFYHIFNMASSGLKKMLYFIIYQHYCCISLFYSGMLNRMRQLDEGCTHCSDSARICIWVMAPFAGRSHKKTPCQIVLEVYSIRGPYIWYMHSSAPFAYSRVPAHGYQLDTYYWTYAKPSSTRTNTRTMAILWWAEITGKHLVLLKGCLF